MDRKTPEELAADLTDGKKSVEAVVNQTVNALYLVRHFTMQFVEKQDEVPLLAHFNLLAPGTDYNSITASQCMFALNALIAGERCMKPDSWCSLMRREGRRRD